MKSRKGPEGQDITPDVDTNSMLCDWTENVKLNSISENAVNSLEYGSCTLYIITLNYERNCVFSASIQDH
jgi:hypothetical protein